MELKIYISYLLVAVSFLISLIFDKDILNFIMQNRVALLNPIMIWMEYIGHQIVIVVMTTSLFLYKKIYSKLITLWIIFISSAAVTYLLKIIIHRARPLVETLIQKTGYSFPSGHVTIIFSTIPIVIREFPRLKYIWIFFALIIAFSRLYLGVHFPSDIIAAAIIGYIIGNIMIYIVEHYIKSYGN